MNNNKNRSWFIGVSFFFFLILTDWAFIKIKFYGICSWRTWPQLMDVGRNVIFLLGSSVVAMLGVQTLVSEVWNMVACMKMWTEPKREVSGLVSPTCGPWLSLPLSSHEDRREEVGCGLSTAPVPLCSVPIPRFSACPCYALSWCLYVDPCLCACPCVLYLCFQPCRLF